jgi:acyl-CoA synthetase (AMP-forming)/AMP-acid ligase II
LSSPPYALALVEADPAEVIEDTTVGDVLRESARLAPDVTALIEGLPGSAGRAWTYHELFAEATRVARAMLEILEPGEKVAIWANNVPEWVLTQLGAALAGLTLVTVNPALHTDEARHVLGQSGTGLVVHIDSYRGFDVAGCVETLTAELPHLRHRVSLSDWPAFVAAGDPTRQLPVVRPGDICQIQYTSGTTGVPKGASLHHLGLVNNARLSYCRHLPLAEGAGWVNSMPLFHTAGSVLAVLGCIQARATHVLMPFFDPALQLELIESHRSVVLGGVPTMIHAMLEHPSIGVRNLGSLRFALSGGSFVEASLIEQVERRLGIPMSVIYAQTEASPGITMTRLDDDRADRMQSVGRALPGVGVRIVDPADSARVLRVGEVGEICTRGFHVMAGYHDAPEQTAAAIDADCWLHTGDLASMDDRGYVSIRGRLKDMIIRGGENIYATEIENALQTHEAVLDSAVVGVPSDYWGEEVGAFVRRQPGADAGPDELAVFLKARLASYKVPTRWWFVDQFPLTATGKILKSELRATAAGTTHPHGGAEGRPITLSAGEVRRAPGN